MNNNFFVSFLISISIHALLLYIPATSLFSKKIDIDVIKAPTSIEISMVRPMPSVKIDVQKVKEVPKKDKIDLSDEKLKKDTADTTNLQAAKPTIGAITEQISSLMVNKPPVYPTLARIKGWEGEVVLIAYISNDGLVVKVNVLSSSGFYILDSAAAKAIAKWHFRNIDKTTAIRIPVKFVLTKN